MSLYTSFKEKVFSRANRAISFQLYSTKKIDPDPFKKEKVAQSLSSNNISTKLKLQYPMFSFYSESVDKALERKKRQIDPPKIEHLKVNDRCKRILSLYPCKMKKQSILREHRNIKKSIRPLIIKNQLKIQKQKKDLERIQKENCQKILQCSANIISIESIHNQKLKGIRIL